MNENQKLLKVLFEVTNNVALTKGQHLEIEQIYKHLNEQLNDNTNDDDHELTMVRNSACDNDNCDGGDCMDHHES